MFYLLFSFSLNLRLQILRYVYSDCLLGSNTRRILNIQTFTDNCILCYTWSEVYYNIIQSIKIPISSSLLKFESNYELHAITTFHHGGPHHEPAQLGCKLYMLQKLSKSIFQVNLQNKYFKSIFKKVFQVNLQKSIYK